jgi:CoA:oxalate CoA-transferase
VSNHLNAGVLPEPMGNENFTAAPSGMFNTETGPLNISANEQKQFEKLCELIGRPDLPKDERYSDRQTRKLHRNELNEEINRALKFKSAEEWETLFNAAGVPAGCVLSVQEALCQPQIVGRGFVETLPGEPVDGHALRVTRPGFLLDEPFPPPSAPPVLGADTAAWLERAGYSRSEIDDMAQRGVVRVA